MENSSPESRRARILGIDFFDGTVEEAVQEALARPGLVLLPAAPALIKLNYDDGYRRALQNADIVIPDSALLARLARLFLGKTLRNVSGVPHLTTAGGLSALWVFGSDEAKQRALTWLACHGIAVSEANCRVCQRETGSSQDHSLLLQIEQLKPLHIVIAFSGGDQERLGLYLREYLVYLPAIYCVGSAVALVSGEERSIPDWAERYNLGWLIRLVSQPTMLLPRIGMALALCAMVARYGRTLRPLRKPWTDV